MPQSYRPRRSRASRIFRQVFDLENATALGGLNHLACFLRQRGLDRKLAERFSAAKSPWSTWPLDRVVRILLDGSFAGIERLFHFEDLETEPLLCAQHGVGRLPDLKTLYRDLRRFEDADLLSSLHALLGEITIDSLRGRKRFVLEFDSTVETLYGRQEGAAIGPNPHKPGRPSYHPLLVRDRISDLVVHHRLRPGDTATSTDAGSFVHKTLDIIREASRKGEILVRADAGFETDEVLSILERRGAGYVVKMRATAELAVAAYTSGPVLWKRIDSDGEGEVEVASFPWRRSAAWQRDRRVVVARKRDREESQGYLFDRFGWSYSLYVTNLDWDPSEVVRFYDKRADVERTICELKHDLRIDHVPTASFGANAADLALKVLARNLLVLYRDRELKLDHRIRVMTLRRRFVWMAGRIVRRAGRLLLRLSASSPLHLVLSPSPRRA